MATEEPSQEITRVEEELLASTRAVPVERVRVRKRIVTETKTITVEVRREELVVDHEPITADAAPGAEAGGASDEAGLELVLMEEQVEVTKHVVPYERVRVVKHRVTEEQAVGGEIRKEAVEIDRLP